MPVRRLSILVDQLVATSTQVLSRGVSDDLQLYLGLSTSDIADIPHHHEIALFPPRHVRDKLESDEGALRWVSLSSD